MCIICNLSNRVYIKGYSRLTLPYPFSALGYIPGAGGIIDIACMLRSELYRLNYFRIVCRGNTPGNNAAKYYANNGKTSKHGMEYLSTLFISKL